MGVLRVRLFGHLELHEDDRPLPPFPTQKSRALFAYLALHGGSYLSRDALAGTFWGEQPDAVARKNLRTELSRVRAVLAAGHAAELLSAQGQALCFDPGRCCWLDVREFSRQQAALAERERSTGEEELAALGEMVALYRADLLAGVYEAWCDFERERLKLQYLGALERLLRHHEARQEWDRAIEAARAVLRSEPLREHVHRDLMRLHLARGDRAAALQQYAQCAELLRRELDTEPMAATRALRDEIVGRTGSEAAPESLRGVGRAGSEPPTDSLRGIVMALDEASDRLRFAREALRGSLSDMAARPRARYEGA